MEISTIKVLLKNQIQIIDKLMGSKSFPKCVKKSILLKTSSNLNKTKSTRNDERDVREIWISLLYIIVKDENLIKFTINKL